ncbi:unnamed protein product [Gongylonema pulchrum]|uniref:Uncharacterized protein n=1 Tax=Gongylonema pulchrum TaxID=637853 RepID=A0A183DZD6_9BILA|nr:unnamed protein product [Gongylonema pulchrum]
MVGVTERPILPSNVFYLPSTDCVSCPQQQEVVLIEEVPTDTSQPWAAYIDRGTVIIRAACHSRLFQEQLHLDQLYLPSPLGSHPSAASLSRFCRLLIRDIRVLSAKQTR